MEQPQDKVRSDPDQWRNDWFAEQLGDGWQTSGDGIYTYVRAEPRSSAGDPDWDRGSKNRFLLPEVPGN